MGKLLKIILLQHLLLMTVVLFGQNKSHKCGTVFPFGLEQRRAAMQVPLPTDQCGQINKVNKTFQISMHIAVNSLGIQNVDQADIDDAMEKLNNDFRPCGFQFQICTTQIMEDDRFDSLTVLPAYNEEIQMTSIYYEPNTINVYLVDTVETDYGLVEGYAVSPGGDDVIVLDKSFVDDESDVFSHEMGHFFGLYHTFETELGLELADGSNCESAGDLVCDTNADPDEDGNADDEDLCNYTGPITQDSNGDWYVPPTDNFMSYYPGECTCRFTIGQYNRMVDQYLTLRNYLW